MNIRRICIPAEELEGILFVVCSLLGLALGKVSTFTGPEILLSLLQNHYISEYKPETKPGDRCYSRKH